MPVATVNKWIRKITDTVMKINDKQNFSLILDVIDSSQISVHLDYSLSRSRFVNIYLNLVPTLNNNNININTLPN